MAERVADRARGRGSTDFTINGIRTKSAYALIEIGGERFVTIYFAIPHTMASDTDLLVDQQRNFALATVAVIAAVATGVSVAILSWNKRLDATVRQKTVELANKSEDLVTSNRSFEESNRQLKAANEQLAESDKKLEANDSL